MISTLRTVAIFVILALPANLSAQTSEANRDESFENRFERVLPTESEETWRAVGWRTNLMEAREVAQQLNRPIFLWIMVGNPHGCT